MPSIISFTHGHSNSVPMVNRVVSLLTLFALFVPGESLCYLPNGKHDPLNKWAEPCSSDPLSPLSTICCQLGWANAPGGDLKNGPTKDECLPNGLCQNRGFSTADGNITKYYRQTCTSENRNTGACLNVCSTRGMDDIAAQIIPCDGTSSSEKWCCGSDPNCCAGTDVFTIPKLFVGLANSTTTSSSLSSSPITAPSTMATVSSGLPKQTLTPLTSSPAAPSTSNSGLDRGGIVGVAVGCFAAVVIVGLGIWFKRRRRGSNPVQKYEIDADTPPGASTEEVNRRELDTESATHEMEATRFEVRAELASPASPSQRLPTERSGSGPHY